MWEFPHREREPAESVESTARRLLAALGIRAEVLGELATIRHTVTRFNITLTCLNAKFRRGKLAIAAYANSNWVQVEDLHDYPLSMPQRKLAKLLAAQAQG
jgi:adenine-specific DNA glycosylase